MAAVFSLGWGNDNKKWSSEKGGGASPFLVEPLPLLKGTYSFCL